MADDARDELERAARKARQARVRSEKKARGTSAEREAKSLRDKQTVRAAMLKEALAGKWGDRLSIGVGLTILFGILLAPIFLPWFGEFGIVTAFGAAVVAIVVSFASVSAIRSALSWRARHRVAAIGYGLDVKRYFALLSEKRRSGQLVVRLHTRRPPVDRESIADAVTGWMPKLSAYWDGDTLRVSSGDIETHEWLSDDGDRSINFTNAPLHTCFMQLVTHVVPKIDAVAAITRIEVDIKGHELAWDTKD